VRFALADGASVLKHVNRASAHRPHRRPSFTCRQHRNLLNGESFCPSFVPADNTWLGSQSRELKVWFEFLTRRHPSLNLGLPCFLFGRVRQVPHRALVNRAARRLGHPASIPRAIMSRSPEALALGPAVISFRRRYHCPSFGCLFNRSRDCRLTFASLRHRRPLLFRAKGSALARARVKSRKIRDRPGRSPRPSARLWVRTLSPLNPLVQAG